MLKLCLYKEKILFEYQGGTFPFRNKEFDTVVSLDVLPHLENYAKEIIKELKRIGEKNIHSFIIKNPEINYTPFLDPNIIELEKVEVLVTENMEHDIIRYIIYF